MNPRKSGMPTVYTSALQSAKAIHCTHRAGSLPGIQPPEMHSKPQRTERSSHR